MRQIRTDLAVELKDINNVTGIKEENEDSNNIHVSRIYITTDDASEKIGKEKGKYVTIEFNKVFEDNDSYIYLKKIIVNEIENIYNKKGPAMIVGLGNHDLTSDALGPLTAEGLIVTRHLKEYAKNIYDNLKLGDVSALIPGVLARTGIESSEVVKAAAEKVKPDVIILVDALAARQMKRLCSTIQISNTGICPGSGVGNNRKAINEQTVGIPVISIGIPTVVDAYTLASDIVQDSGIQNAEKIQEGISEYENNLIVTPRDIDSLIIKCSRLLSESLNKVFHPEITTEDIAMLLDK